MNAIVASVKNFCGRRVRTWLSQISCELREVRVCGLSYHQCVRLRMMYCFVLSNLCLNLLGHKASVLSFCKLLDKVLRH